MKPSCRDPLRALGPNNHKDKEMEGVNLIYWHQFYTYCMYSLQIKVLHRRGRCTVTHPELFSEGLFTPVPQSRFLEEVFLTWQQTGRGLCLCSRAASVCFIKSAQVFLLRLRLLLFVLWVPQTVVESRNIRDIVSSD